MTGLVKTNQVKINVLYYLQDKEFRENCTHVVKSQSSPLGDLDSETSPNSYGYFPRVNLQLTN